jgi:predicted DNA-binding transcriptional regulator AlpA
LRGFRLGGDLGSDWRFRCNDIYKWIADGKLEVKMVRPRKVDLQARQADEIMSAEEVAQYLGCHLITLYRLIHKAKFPPSSSLGIGDSGARKSIDG